MTITTVQAQALEETLSKLELALLTPPIAGEMSNWARTVKEAAATLATDWTRELNTVLHPQYAQIAQTDPEMLSCVERMKQEEQALAEELACFHEELHKLEVATTHVDWQESKLAALQKRVEHDGLQLILRMKKQQITASTWLAEAVYRDRGVKD
jgi:hypothetical protein